jgi:DNA polymerase-3 subunit delta'
MSNSSTVSRLAALEGLDRAKRTVLSLALDGSSHAVLLFGEVGAGKRTLAQVLAQAWLCTQPDENGACGECRACVSFSNGNSADLLVIAPMGKSDWITVKQTTGEGEKRDDDPVPIREFLRTGPLSAKRKVVLILKAERMNHRAANSILKILEEPPPFAKLILTTDAVGKMLPTILSRCLAVACELPPERAEGNVGLLSRGAPGRAHALEERWGVFEALWEISRDVRRLGPSAALRLSERFRQAAEKLEVRDVVGARLANTEALEHFARILQLEGFSGASIQAAIEAHRLVQGNGNAGLVLDSLFIRLTMAEGR